MTRHALLVGINGYPPSSGLVPLKYAEADAAALAEVPRARGGFSTTLLLGQQATRDAIEEALLSAGQGDLVPRLLLGNAGAEAPAFVS